MLIDTPPDERLEKGKLADEFACARNSGWEILTKLPIAPPPPFALSKRERKSASLS